MNLTRREMLRELLMAGLSVTAASAVLAGCGSNSSTSDNSTNAAPAAGTTAGTASSGGPIRLGFIPLTDCASLVVADQMGYFKKHGVQVEVVKMANWNAVRDQISSGQLQGAHCLFGMPFALATGVSKASGDPLKIAMMINQNGQATTLSSKFADKAKYADFPGLKSAVDGFVKAGDAPTFGMTFPGGTHDMWMHLTLVNAGLDPKALSIKPTPPPQMVANMKAGNLDGYNVGEPWGGRAVAENIGYTFIATQDLWKDHPEKALVVNGKFAEARRDDLKKVMMAMLEASKFIDEMKNRPAVAKTIGTKAYVGAEPSVIEPRLMGKYDLGGGNGTRQMPSVMQFYRDGNVNFPRHGHAVWFMAAYERFGKAKLPADPMKIANDVILQDLYKEVAAEMKIAVPDDDMKPFEVKVDAMTFDPNKPAEMVKMLMAQDMAKRKSMA